MTMIAKDLPAEALRHRWEMPMIWIAVALTVLPFVLLIGLESGALEPILAVMGPEARAAVEDFSDIVVLLVGAPFAFYVVRFFIATKDRAQSIKVGPEQFPALWHLYTQIAAKMDMPTLPRLYVKNGNGVVNAYALSCNRRHKYVVLHAEIACLVESHPQIVAFVIAHELAHHKLGHVALWRIIVSMVPNLLFLPGKAVIRVQEYSADRLAFHHCPDCIDDRCSFLGVGPTMAGQVNPEALYKQTVEDDRSLWIRLHNILSDHAVLTKRFKALKDMEQQGIDSHGQMF